MASVEELRERMDRAVAIEDPLDRRLWVLAVITEFLAASGVKPILVGGTAVEFYTAGGYFTFDMDVVADTRMMDAAMTEMGFIKSGRHWLREDIGISLEAPSEAIDDPDRVFTLEIDDMKAYIVGIEDLIIDRLNAYVHWQSAEDGRWVAHLIDENRDQLDLDYLGHRAREEKTADALAEILRRGSEDRR